MQSRRSPVQRSVPATRLRGDEAIGGVGNGGDGGAGAGGLLLRLLPLVVCPLHDD